MGISLVNPATQPSGGGIPPNPLAAAFSNAVAAYGSRIPSPMDQAGIDLQNAQTQKIQQENSSGNSLANTFAAGIGAVPAGSVNADGSPMSHDQWAQSQIVGIARAAMNSGHPEAVGALARAMMLSMPGGTSDQTQSDAMMGAGDAYTSSREGMTAQQQAETARQIAVQRSANQGQLNMLQFKADHGGMTDEQMNRTNKINDMMKTQGIDRKTAEAVVDGVIEGGVSPYNGQKYVINKLDVMGRGAGSPSIANGNGDADYLTQLTSPNSGSPAVATPAAQTPIVPLKDGDLTVDMKDAVGTGPLLSRIQNATTGGASTAPAVAEGRLKGMVGALMQLDNMKSRMSGALANTVKGQLPDATFEADDPRTWLKLGTADPAEDQAMLLDKVNRELIARQAYSKIAADTTQPAEARKSANDFVQGIDRFAEEYLTPGALANFQKSTGVVGNQPIAAPPTNLQAGTAATTKPAGLPSGAKLDANGRVKVIDPRTNTPASLDPSYLAGFLKDGGKLQ